MERRNELRSNIEFAKFCSHAPTAQDAIDLFEGRWTSDLSEVDKSVTAGSARLFVSDRRPRFVLKQFANAFGNLQGKRILELGPLEGGHTYQLEQLGADSIVAVEANAEAYLKCLIVKEVVGLKRATFLFGDVIEYLRAKPTGFDIIFCSGILYHMEDPLQLIELMTDCTDNVFLWTHYWIPGPSIGDVQEREAVLVERWNQKFTYFRQRYGGRDAGTFWGGNRDHCSWLLRDDILRAFRLRGFTEVEIHAEEMEHQYGPNFSLSLWRPA